MAFLPWPAVARRATTRGRESAVDIAHHALREAKGPAKFRARARLRTPTELLDANYLYYRYDWVCTNARVHCEVLQERHYALNWLIGYQHQTWDASAPVPKI